MENRNPMRSGVNIDEQRSSKKGATHTWRYVDKSPHQQVLVRHKSKL